MPVTRASTSAKKNDDILDRKPIHDGQKQLVLSLKSLFFVVLIIYLLIVAYRNYKE